MNYQVILFDLINALVTFQSYINKILAEKINVFIIVYFDDIFIYIESERKEHVKAIQWILDQLQKYLLYANLKKCQFYQDKIKFLNYIISYQYI